MASPIPQRTRAVLLLVPEQNSHGGYYQRFAGALAGHGIACHALDHAAPRAADRTEAIDALAGARPPEQSALPLFLLGHGMGALSAGLYALEHPGSLTGLICESILLEPNASTALIPVLDAIAPALPAFRLPHAGASRDAAIVRRMNADPLIRERLPARAAAAMLRARRRLRGSLADLDLPLLILHGSADAIARPSGSEYLHEQAGSHDKTLQIFEGYYHDLLNDLGHEHVVERIRQWIEARLKPGHRGQIGIAWINADP